MSSINRRNFFKVSGLAAVPAFIPAQSLFANKTDKNLTDSTETIVMFMYDGEFFDGESYLEELKKANFKQPIKVDRYGSGGAVEELEKKFTAITGKEAAIYMPSGTMANQFAIAVLSGESTKVFVQDTSHVYRDEADAAQSVFNKRLMPLAKNETYFTADALIKAIADLEKEEAFKTGIGCVSIECPVRRTDGRLVPIEEIKKISTFCRSNNIRLHLDGARLYMASAWTGISIKEYSSYFDTVYISLYKYLGASAGAILCGDKNTIGKMPHLIKIHGGNQFGNWLNAAMAVQRLDGFEERLKTAIARSKEIFAGINKIPGFKVSSIDGGTNIYTLMAPANFDLQKFSKHLSEKYFIRIPFWTDENGMVKIFVNETLLHRETSYIINAIIESIRFSVS